MNHVKINVSESQQHEDLRITVNHPGLEEQLVFNVPGVGPAPDAIEENEKIRRRELWASARQMAEAARGMLYRADGPHVEQLWRSLARLEAALGEERPKIPRSLQQAADAAGPGTWSNTLNPEKWTPGQVCARVREMRDRMAAEGDGVIAARMENEMRKIEVASDYFQAMVDGLVKEHGGKP